MTKKYQITDEGQSKKYFTQIPNIIDETKMSLPAFRLYFHLKRVAGDNGTCWQSTKTLADACFMSTGAVSKVKKELVDLKLITIQKEKNLKGGRDFDHIKILDIWLQNVKKFASSSLSEVVSSSPSKKTSSPSELKKIDLKEESLKILWETFLKNWKELFPNKPQPQKNNATLKKKLISRIKEPLYIEKWETALERASESTTLQEESWFNAMYFLNNSENYMKCYERWMSWKDQEQYGHKSNGVRPTRERNLTEERLSQQA